MADRFGSLKSSGGTSIWEKERLAEEERKRQSSAVRSHAVEQLRKVTETMRLQNYHPGLFKTVYRETFDSAGNVLLKPEGMMWNCCLKGDDSAPGCQSAELSPYHSKCEKCGEFFLDFENTSKGCFYHSKAMCRPPTDDSDIVAYHCCMKQVPSKGCQQNNHVVMASFKINPSHATGPLAPSKEEIAKLALASKKQNAAPAKKFDPSKVRVRRPDDDGSPMTSRAPREKADVPIWERERQEHDMRRQQSMMIKNMKQQLKEQAEGSMEWTNAHPGLFKTTYRENVDPSTGNVLLKPEGSIWTCCRYPNEDAPGCQQMRLSPLFDKCKRCGDFFMEIDNKDKSCTFHEKNLCKPPDYGSDVVCWQCCMKPVEGKGCQLGRHVPNTGYTHKFGQVSKATAQTRAQSAVVEDQILKMETAVKDVLAGVKEIYVLIETRAKTPEIVIPCRRLVGNMKALEDRGNLSGSENVKKSVSDFKAAATEIIKALQMACKSEYQDAIALKDFKNACSATISAAKILIPIIRKMTPPDVNVSRPVAVGPPPPPPSFTPPPPPPMGGSMSKASTTKKSGGKSEVLNQIGGFNRGMLKKTVTVDKSKPIRTADIEEGDEE